MGDDQTAEASPEAESPSLLDRLRRYLRESGIAFREIEHEPVARASDYSRALGTRLQQQAKCLLVRLKKGKTAREYVLVAVQAQKQVDLQHIATLTRSRSARLADRDQLMAVAGCGFGELPPVGKPMGLRLLMDRDLLDEDEIYFNAGRLDVSMAVAPGRLAEVEEAILF